MDLPVIVHAKRDIEVTSVDLDLISGVKDNVMSLVVGCPNAIN